MVLEWILLVVSVITGLAVLWGKLEAKDEGESTIVDYGRALFPVVIIVFALRSFVAEPFRIPSGSMLPTLHLGDFILVNKSAYGIKLPIIYKKVIPTGTPKRGDVVVFRYPRNPKVNYIKRLVGLPGDKIEARNGRLLVNDVEMESEITKENHIASDRRRYIGSIKSEQLGDVTHDILVTDRSRQNPFDRVIVPAGHYFVMGDNRDNSSDSRVWGFVPQEHMVGRAFFIWMSWNVVGGGGVDWGRIGTLIE